LDQIESTALVYRREIFCGEIEKNDGNYVVEDWKDDGNDVVVE